MRKIHGFLIGLAAAAGLGRAEAVVTYTFTETAGGVRLSYAGAIDTSGLSFQGGLSSTARYIDIQGASPALGHQMYEFQNMQFSSVYPGQPGSSFRYSAVGIVFDWNMTLATPQFAPSASDGQTFGFYIFARNGGYTTWMNLPPAYVSGQPIVGSQTFAGQTFASMGLTPDENFQVFLPGDEKIVGVVAVPEASALALCGYGVFLMLGIRRRVRRTIGTFR